MSHYIKLAPTESIPNQQGRCFQAAGRAIAVFNLDGTFYAMEDDCPHAGASMSDGAVHEEHVVCPWHYAEFHVPSGKAVAGPVNRDLQCFSVCVKDGFVLIDADEL